MGNQRSKASAINQQQPEKGRSAPSENRPHVPGEGIRSMKTSNVFRAVNFELYAKPSKPIMIVGAAGFTLAMGYLLYLRYKFDRSEYYEAFNEDGSVILRERKSRWDS